MAHKELAELVLLEWLARKAREALTVRRVPVERALSEPRARKAREARMVPKEPRALAR